MLLLRKFWMAKKFEPLTEHRKRAILRYLYTRLHPYWSCVSYPHFTQPNTKEWKIT